MREEVVVAGRQFHIDPVDGTFTAHSGRGTPESFWDLVRGGRWEPDVFAFLAKHIAPGSRFLDVGGWIGPFSLFAASLGANVVAVEPDPAAAARLLANRAANPQMAVDVVNAALHPEAGPLRLFADAFGDSETSVHSQRRRGSRDKRAVASVLCGTIAARPLLALIDGPLDVIKIDIEGGEFEAAEEVRELVSAARRAFVLSLHPQNVYGEGEDYAPALGRRKSQDLLRSLPDMVRATWTARKERFDGTWSDLLSFAADKGENLDTVFAERSPA